jgi:hypothetical protein
MTGPTASTPVSTNRYDRRSDRYERVDTRYGLLNGDTTRLRISYESCPKKSVFQKIRRRGGGTENRTELAGWLRIQLDKFDLKEKGLTSSGKVSSGTASVM